MSHPNRLVIYITDPGFLVPTLQVARQVAAQSSGIADNLVYLIDVPAETTEKIQQDFSASGLRFRTLEARDYMPSADTFFRPGHVPPVALARLIIADYIPEQYEHILYLDGDTQVCGDIRPLLSFTPPSGMIGTVNGSLWLKYGRDHGRDAEYLASMNNLAPEEYFNSGVISFNRRDWKEIGPAALRFYFDHSRGLHHHDQSALNAVCKGRRVALSPVNNFHSEYARLFLSPPVQPRLVHFTGNTKPWKYPVHPWGCRFARPYHQLLAEYPYLRQFFAPVPLVSPGWELLRGVKFRLPEFRNMPSILGNRRLFRNYMASTAFPV